MKRILLSFILVLLLGNSALQGGRLFRVRTGNPLGENGVQLKTAFERSGYLGMAIHNFRQEIVYGIANQIDFTIDVPLLALEGVGDSLIIGDLGLEMMVGIHDWVSSNTMAGVYALLGIKVGISVEEGEGKRNPATGELQQYFPFAKGLTELYLGGGYSFTVAGLSTHFNLLYYLECRETEQTFDFKVGNDHVELAAAVEYYTATRISLFGGGFSLGIKPYYEMRFLVSWQSTAAMPSRMDNVIALWLRFGKVLRLSGGFNFPVALTSSRFLDSESFIALAAVFR